MLKKDLIVNRCMTMDCMEMERQTTVYMVLLLQLQVFSNTITSMLTVPPLASFRLNAPDMSTTSWVSKIRQVD